VAKILLVGIYNAIVSTSENLKVTRELAGSLPQGALPEGLQGLFYSLMDIISQRMVNFNSDKIQGMEAYGKGRQ
jgi:hypothetical protein